MVMMTRSWYYGGMAMFKISTTDKRKPQEPETDNENGIPRKD